MENRSIENAENYERQQEDINYVRSILCVVESTNLNDLQLNLLLNFNNHQHDINLAKLENDKLILQKELEIIKNDNLKAKEHYEISIGEAKKKWEIELNESKKSHEMQLNESRRKHEIELNESRRKHEMELIKIKYDKKMEYAKLIAELKFQNLNDHDLDNSLSYSNY
jgi:hypothetical protein